MTIKESDIPYWLVNVPPSEWPASCPEYLVNITPKARHTLSTPDERYRRHTWEDVQEIIRTNRIHLFQRVPSSLRRYFQYTAKLKLQYGSILNFIVNERLKWGDDLQPKGAPFTCDSDIKILYNDWPYGVETDIVHLVVWTKFELEDDPATDDLTPKARREIEDYVQKTFCRRVPAEQVVWFKNWRSLKSVHAVEHFHVMIKDPDMDFIREITNCDVPLVEKVQ